MQHGRLGLCLAHPQLFGRGQGERVQRLVALCRFRLWHTHELRAAGIGTRVDEHVHTRRHRQGILLHNKGTKMEGTKKIFVRTDDVAFFGPKKKKKGFLNPQKKENNTHDSHLVPHGSTK